MNGQIQELQARLDVSKKFLVSFLDTSVNSKKNSINTYNPIKRRKCKNQKLKSEWNDRGCGKKLLAPVLKSPTRRDKASDYFVKVTFNMSKLPSGEWLSSPTSRPLTRVTPEAPRIRSMWLDPTKISGGIFEDESHADTWLLGERCRTLLFQRVDKHRLSSINQTRMKHLVICYIYIKEASATGIWKVWFMKVTQKNSNISAKILSGTYKEKEVENWVWQK